MRRMNVTKDGVSALRNVVLLVEERKRRQEARRLASLPDWVLVLGEAAA